MSTIRKAARADLDAVCRIYDQIHTAEERGEAAIGWQRGVYPERETATFSCRSRTVRSSARPFSTLSLIHI